MVSDQLINFYSRLKKQKIIVISIVSTLLLSSTALGVQRTVLSVYTGELDSSFSRFLILSAAIALASYGISKAIGNYLGGQLSQSRGRKPTEIIGVILLIIGSVILAITKTLSIFFIGNSFVGLGIGTLFASSAISLTDIVPTKDRAKAISLMELSVYLGTAFGALFAGLLGVSNLPFIVALVLAIITFFVSLNIRETSHLGSKTEEVKFPSLLDKLQMIRDKIPHEVNITTGILKDMIITDIDSNKTAEVVEITHTSLLRRFTSPSLLVVFSTGMISRIADTMIILIFPLLILEFGYSAIQLGIFTSVFTLFWAIGIAITGPLSDSIGRKTPLFLGEFIEATGYIIILFLDLSSWFPIVFLGTMVAGFGRGIYFPIPPSAATELVSPRDKARTLGIYRFILDFGYVIGSVLVVLFIDFRSDNSVNLFEPVFTLIIGILLILGILTIIFLKDPKPGFKQLDDVSNHLDLVAKSIQHATNSIYYIKYDNDRSREFILDSKIYEQKADLILEKMTMQTYSGGWRAPDAFEVLQLSNMIDKVAGFAIRAVRKIHLLDSNLPDTLHELIMQYAIIMELLLKTSQETISLISVRIDFAAEHSYQVSFVEEILDSLHKSLWNMVMNLSDELSPLSLILLTQSIDSLEKGANMLEDAIEIIRILAFKHQEYMN